MTGISTQLLKTAHSQPITGIPETSTLQWGPATIREEDLTEILGHSAFQVLKHTFSQTPPPPAPPPQAQQGLPPD